MRQSNTNVGWVSDSVTQQIQEQSPNYGGRTEMSGYATLTRPTKPDELEFVGIPKEWCRSKLGEIADQITKGTTPTTAGFQYLNTGIPFIKIENINQYGIDLNSLSQFISEDAHKALLRSQFQEGDILFSIAGTIGKTALVTQAHIPANTNQAIAIIRGTARIFDVKFLRQQLRQSAEAIAKSNARGGAMNNISLGDLKEVELSIPSLSEQQQIAAKLDELLAQVDILKSRLDTIPKILKRFRQSVLASAVSGKLTKDWRSDERYTKTEFGFSIPYKWHLLVIDDIAEVKGGKRLPKGEALVSENTGYPYIRAGQLKNGTVVEDNQLFLLKHVQTKISNYIVNTGDLYITIVGACIGDAGIIPSNYDGANLTENAAKLCLFKKPLKDQFLSNWLRSQYLQDIIQREIKSGAQGKLALKRIKTLPFPYPSLEEQTEIIKRVEQLFTYAAQIEQRVKDAQARVNHLTQAILAKAFRGELTAEWREQNPELITGENSAEALLAIIKAERETIAATKQIGRKAKA